MPANFEATQPSKCFPICIKMRLYLEALRKIAAPVRWVVVRLFLAATSLCLSLLFLRYTHYSPPMDHQRRSDLSFFRSPNNKEVRVHGPTRSGRHHPYNHPYSWMHTLATRNCLCSKDSTSANICRVVQRLRSKPSQGSEGVPQVALPNPCNSDVFDIIFTVSAPPAEKQKTCVIAEWDQVGWLFATVGSVAFSSKLCWWIRFREEGCIADEVLPSMLYPPPS